MHWIAENVSPTQSWITVGCQRQPTVKSSNYPTAEVAAMILKYFEYMLR
jgi:hypothetical protein